MREWKSFPLLIGLLLFGPVIAILLLDTYRVIGITNKLARERLQAGLELRTDALARRLEDALELGAILAAKPSIEAAIASKDRGVLWSEARSEIDRVAKRGLRVVGATYELETGNVQVHAPQLPKTDWARTLEFEDDAAFVSWIGMAGGALYLEIIAPVIMGDANAGYLRLVVEADFLGESLSSRAGLGETGLLALVSRNQDGAPFMIVPSSVAAGAQHPPIEEGDLEAMPLWSSGGADKSYGGWRDGKLGDRDVFYSWRTVPLTQWTMIAVQDSAEIHAGIVRIGVTGLVFVILTLTGFCVLLYRTIINQILGLHQQASEFAAGAAGLRESFRYEHSFEGLKRTLRFIIDAFNQKQAELAALLERRDSEIAEATAKVKAQEKDLQDMGRTRMLAQISRLVAHDINQPLTTIRLVLENNSVEDGEWTVVLDQKAYDDVDFSLGRIANLTSRLRDSVRTGGDIKRVNVPFAKIVKDCEIETSKRVGGARARLTIVGGPEVSVFCDDFTIHSVIKNLIENAADAFHDHPDIYVREIQVFWSVEGNRLVVNVADTAGGIPEAIRDRIYELGFTTKGVGKGTGWGLSQSRDGVEQHGGTLMNLDYQGVGTVFTFDIPITQTGS